MNSTRPLGQLLQSFFVEHLITVKGLRPASVRSYRDTIRLLLVFAAAEKGCKITSLTTSDLSFERVVGFLRHLEEDRGNHPRTRNQRLAAVHTLFDYIATRDPEMLGICQRVAAIPMKRAAPAETRFLERDEIEELLAHLPRAGRLALRDRAAARRLAAGDEGALPGAPAPRAPTHRLFIVNDENRWEIAGSYQ
jgi:integrase/recombinase XerD